MPRKKQNERYLDSDTGEHPDTSVEIEPGSEMAMMLQGTHPMFVYLSDWQRVRVDKLFTGFKQIAPAIGKSIQYFDLPIGKELKKRLRTNARGQYTATARELCKLLRLIRLKNYRPGIKQDPETGKIIGKTGMEFNLARGQPIPGAKVERNSQRKTTQVSSPRAVSGRRVAPGA